MTEEAQNMKDIIAETFLRTQQPRLLTAGSVPLLLKSANPIAKTIRLQPKNKTDSLSSAGIVDLSWFDFYCAAILVLTQTNHIQNFKHPACLCRGLEKGVFCPYCRLTNFYQQNMEAGKLSIKGWMTLLKVLQIDVENPQVTIRQVKNLRHLLIFLVDNCELIKNGSVTEDELKLWLETKLSKGYLEILPLISGQATDIKASPANPKKAKKKKPKANQKTETSQPKAEFVGAETPKRKPVSDQNFNEVAHRQGMYCFWCGVKVVREKQIPSSLRIGRRKSKIIYLQDGNICQATTATIDHLERVCEGGNNDPENLVISCYPCNRQRSYQRLKYLSQIKKSKVSCPNCFSKFVRFDTKVCSICGADTKEKKNFSGKAKEYFESFWKLVRTAF